MIAAVVAALILPLHTPGALNPAVTQATLGATVCRSGYTAAIRPPVSYTNRLKAEQLVRFGYRDRNPAHYEEDHLIPLELGGAPSSSANLWPEPRGQAALSDPLENALRRQLCAGALTLQQAQRRIRSWKRNNG